jgi:hypothetical protein
MDLNEYKGLIEFIDNRSKRLLLEKGEVRPHAFLVRDHRDTGIEVLLFPFDPDTVLEELSPVAREFGPECIITVSEAWASNRMDGGRPSQQSDRREVLILNSEHVDHNMVCITNHITRKENGKIKTVSKDYGTGSIDEVKGRLANLLSKIIPVGTVSPIKRHPGYKAHFKSDKYTVH